MEEAGEKILKVNIEEEMKSAYIDYSMSVIISRALPDVRDGLKPVQRRVLFGMNELGLFSNRAYKKSARIVGEVLGKYHPHGDTSVYEAMVRMAQEWSLRYPMIDGQGNFGSIDGDSPAAMRYTEARLKKLAEEALADLDKNTVEFNPNFDDSLEEPSVLPARIPNLLINGASGIAVGMATNMPPHNLGEVVDGIIAFIDNNEISIDELVKFIIAPDFPTGGIIYGYQGVKDAFETGRGRIVIRSKSHVETSSGSKETIIVTEIPYQVNKEELIKKVADLINEKKIEGITNVNDESDKNGMRIVFELRKDAVAGVILNKLYKFTALQTSYNVNNITLVDGRPKLLNIKDLINQFVNHRHEVVIRRTKFDLSQSEKKAHIYEGLLIALDYLDEVISLIRASKTPDEAKEGLMQNFSLTDIQSGAILDLRLQRLTGLEREKIKADYEELIKQINYLKNILNDKSLRMNIIKDELIEIKDKYSDARRTEVVYTSEDFNPEDLYADDEVAITISHLGYIKRTSLTEYRTQNRGGVGSKGVITRDEDFLEHLFIATMHNTLLFFTENGKCFWLKAYEIPEGTKASKGRAIQNLLNIEPEDKVRAYINVKTLTDKTYVTNNYIILCTKKGIIKKTSLIAYSRPRLNGIIAINIREGDRLIEAKLTNGNHELILAVKSGRAIHFHEKKVRPMGRNASGVRGIRLSNESDEVVGMVIADVGGNENVLVVSENGYGKRSKLEDYRVTNRGGKGVKTINVTEKTGKLIGIKTVIDADDVMIITRSGNIIRLDCKKIRVLGRATQGVKLIQIKDNDSIAAVATVENNEQKNGDNADEIQNGNDWNGIENNNDISDEEMMNNDEEIEDENNGDTKEK